MHNVIDLGFFNDEVPLALTKVAGSAIVETGLKHNAPSFHFEVTTLWGGLLTSELFVGRVLNTDAVMRHCYSKRDENIEELFDDGGCVTFMLGHIIRERVEVRIAFVHKSIVHLVGTSQLWSGEIPALQAA